MIIYEVNLSIKPEHYEAYYAWLKPHMQDMLTLDGFTSARCYKVMDTNNDPSLCIHYQVNSIEQLEHYFQHSAEKMREEALRLFPGQFTANRRVLEELIPT